MDHIFVAFSEYLNFLLKNESPMKDCRGNASKVSFRGRSVFFFKYVSKELFSRGVDFVITLSQNLEIH